MANGTTVHRSLSGPPVFPLSDLPSTQKTSILRALYGAARKAGKYEKLAHLHLIAATGEKLAAVSKPQAAKGEEEGEGIRLVVHGDGATADWKELTGRLVLPVKQVKEKGIRVSVEGMMPAGVDVAAISASSVILGPMPQLVPSPSASCSSSGQHKMVHRNVSSTTTLAGKGTTYEEVIPPPPVEDGDSTGRPVGIVCAEEARRQGTDRKPKTAAQVAKKPSVGAATNARGKGAGKVDGAVAKQPKEAAKVPRGGARYDSPPLHKAKASGTSSHGTTPSLKAPLLHPRHPHKREDPRPNLTPRMKSKPVTAAAANVTPPHRTTTSPYAHQHTPLNTIRPGAGAPMHPSRTTLPVRFPCPVPVDKAFHPPSPYLMAAVLSSDPLSPPRQQHMQLHLMPHNMSSPSLHQTPERKTVTGTPCPPVNTRNFPPITASHGVQIVPPPPRPPGAGRPAGGLRGGSGGDARSRAVAILMDKMDGRVVSTSLSTYMARLHCSMACVEVRAMQAAWLLG
ncbi:unnamed protein product [Vitrella brassicaformis CCMP3155]|uniref:Uncharacterized protein n=3 Tax=Vitrella brassicaformis TaxID=1169539 RepID=A0A0G4EN62_VITBC|nr:unnamed protein product [Vitrella brassicaformis CCMP3155]|eukprot:CEL98556.1 unnamed protein product [Vitrella brassicaformis CCMP3155]